MHRWKFSVLAAAALVSTGLFTADAQALALGQIHVRSALGEPLRAEIDLPQITPAEAESLKAGTASPGVYRAQGLEYTPTVNDIQVQLQRRTDGSAVLRLSSSKAVNDPFVDLVIDASWASGHIVRSYTLLLDPPDMRRNAAPATNAPQISSGVPAPMAAPRAQTAPSVVEPPITAAPAPRRAEVTQERRAAQAQRAVAAPAPASDEAGAQVRVNAGDTAGRIAGANRPAGVSLDQMLVAMLRANPDAFVNGNVNRLRSGAVLQLPSEAQAQATPAGEARKIIAAQSRDFNEFRRRLATAAPAAEVGTPQRAATGSVQSQVDDQKPGTASADKLTLSKGGIQAQVKDEKLARDRQSNQNAERMAELSKNISELNKLSTSAGAPAGSASTPSTAATKPADLPAVATVSATSPAAVASAAAAAASTAAAASSDAAQAARTAASDATSGTATAATATASDAASAAVEAASAASAATPAASAPKKPRVVVAPPPPPPEPSFLDTLTEDPLMLGGGAAILLLLLGYGGYRVAQRRKAAAAMPADSSMMDSQLQPDSFFGASGGQRVDTANSGLSTGSSSLAYSPSQLDAGEVDPVAEADVYLAYGRDLQAEEILREAARIAPDRTSIHVKLAEIYAKRQDRKALEAQAKELHTLTGGQGADWARVAELGRTHDPDNSLYQTVAGRAAAAGLAGAAGLAAAAAVAAPAPSNASVGHHLDLDAPSTLPVEFHSAGPAETPSVLADLDLDLDLGTPAPPPTAPASPAAEPSLNWTAPAASPAPSLPDFELPPLNPDALAAPAVTPPASAAPQGNGLDFELDDLGFTAPSPAPSARATADTEESTARQPLEFDLGSLSLDLENTKPAFGSSGVLEEASAPALTGAGSGTALPDDPLTTKLALAEEFNAIGDSEGARTLVEEVIAEASGELKARAQQMLARLG